MFKWVECKASPKTEQNWILGGILGTQQNLTGSWILLPLFEKVVQLPILLNTKTVSMFLWKEGIDHFTEKGHNFPERIENGSKYFTFTYWTIISLPVILSTKLPLVLTEAGMEYVELLIEHMAQIYWS